MERIGIVQLSDLQFGTKHIFGHPSTIGRKLASDVQMLSEKHRFTPVYLVVSGDITETASRTEFEDAYLQLEDIRHELFIDDNAVLYVPGNHDINWKLSDVGEELSDPGLKYRNFHLFEHKFEKEWSFEFASHYPTHIDHRLGIVFGS
jgi:3',5'-cyclic AMP phosphodiesterase CpdA